MKAVPIYLQETEPEQGGGEHEQCGRIFQLLESQLDAQHGGQG